MCCIVVDHWFQKFKHCFLTSFSGTRFPLAGFGLISNDGVADCFVTATRNTKMFGAAFGGLLSFR